MNTNVKCGPFHRISKLATHQVELPHITLTLTRLPRSGASCKNLTARVRLTALLPAWLVVASSPASPRRVVVLAEPAPRPSLLKPEAFSQSLCLGDGGEATPNLHEQCR